MVKLVNMFTAIYFYSLYGNIDVNHGNYVLINNHGHNILELYNVLIKARLTTSNHDSQIKT